MSKPSIPLLTSVAGLFVEAPEWRWRMPCLLQVFGPAVVLALVVTAPESPRWLVSKGKMEEAKAMIVKHHANGKEDDPLAMWEYNEIVTTIQKEQTDDKSRYIDFFRTKGNRKRLWVTVFLGMGSNWVGNGILGCRSTRGERD